MFKNTEPKKQMTKQTTMFGTYEFPSYEEIMDAYAKEFKSYVIPKVTNGVRSVFSNLKMSLKSVPDRQKV